jgi:hypothetical protein
MWSFYFNAHKNLLMKKSDLLDLLKGLSREIEMVLKCYGWIFLEDCQITYDILISICRRVVKNLWAFARGFPYKHAMKNTKFNVLVQEATNGLKTSRGSSPNYALFIYYNSGPSQSSDTVSLNRQNSSQIWTS